MPSARTVDSGRDSSKSITPLMSDANAAQTVHVSPNKSQIHTHNDTHPANTADGGAQPKSGHDHKRYIHVDIVGGSNNFGSKGGHPSESGGKGGTLASKLHHIHTQQSQSPTACNHANPHHNLCHTCNATKAKTAFADNYISTTKYNLLSFIPLNLFEQFQKKANFYFLLVAIVSLTPLSPKTPVVSVAPLVLVLTVSAIKEAIEDFARYKMDKKINSSVVDTWRNNGDSNVNGHGFEPVAWADLIVGDLVFVREGQSFPADIILLQSSSDQGIANIETANLDGETNLKTKQAVPELWRIPVKDGPVAPAGGAAKQRVPLREAQMGSSGSVDANMMKPLQVPPSKQVSPRAIGSSSNGDEGLSSRSNPKSAREGNGLKWPLKLPPFIIESSAPSKKLDGSAWKGNLEFVGGSSKSPHPHASIEDIANTGDASAGSQAKIALGMNQLLLRGCVLRNTKWICGVVLFTGVETKLMLNNRPAKLKRSHVDRIVDQSLYILFGLEFVLCSLGAIANYLWLDAWSSKMWSQTPDLFADPTDGPAALTIRNDAGLSWFTYMVLIDILIPISLYVSMELVKFTQAYLINRDVEMYHPETNTPAQARTSNLNEELGQVSYVFSDKTGTLTCNIMNFVACSVDGQEYGLEGNKDESYEPIAIPSFKGIPPVDDDFPFKDTRMVRSLLNGSNDKVDLSLIDQFLTLLATCHSVLPDFPQCMKEHVHVYDESCKFPAVYQASSPDEKALTIAAKNNQYYFYHREPMQIHVGGAGGIHPTNPHHHQSGGSAHNAHSPNPTSSHASTTALATPSGALSTPSTSSSTPIVSGGGGSGSATLQRPMSHFPSGAPTSMHINGEKMLVNILGTSHTFLILDSFEFTSERARMSVILIDPRDGFIKVYTKGADTKMYKLLNEASKASAVWSKQEKSLNTFSEMGLRTLITGYKVLSEEEYLTWAHSYAAAKSAIDNREERVAAAQNAIEQNLTLIGSTAIEDRLQDGVPDAISKLSQAGMRIWILTGDKAVTAKEIAKSCNLVTSTMVKTGLIEIIIDDKASEEEALASTKKQLDEAERKISQIASKLAENEASDELGIIVSGSALTHIFQIVRDEKGREILYENLNETQRKEADILRDQFLNVCKKCKAVVCCRVSPNQKAEVVSLVKNKLPDKITLAIGDGANDVSMIKAAHVGIGISGLEGLQAVMASDYSIAQFRFLTSLLLVHGHWSYERISKLILYSFYKNISIALTSIWFAFFSGFSAQLFYDPYAGSVYNIIFTSMPVMLAAVFDRDVSRKSLLKYPALYGSGIHNQNFSVWHLLRIIFEGFAHSIVLYFGCHLLFNKGGDVIVSEGTTHDLWVMSTAMYSYLVFVVNFRIALDTTTFTWVNHLFLFLSVLAWFVFILIYCVANVTPNMWNVPQYLFGSITFWLGLLVIVAICIVPEVAWMFWRRMYQPTEKDIVMEIERGYGVEPTPQDQRGVVHVRAASPDRSLKGTRQLDHQTSNRTTNGDTAENGNTTADVAAAGGHNHEKPSLIVQISHRSMVTEEAEFRPPSAQQTLFPPNPLTADRNGGYHVSNPSHSSNVSPRLSHQRAPSGSFDASERDQAALSRSGSRVAPTLGHTNSLQAHGSPGNSNSLSRPVSLAAQQSINQIHIAGSALNSPASPAAGGSGSSIFAADNSKRGIKTNGVDTPAVVRNDAKSI